LSQSKKTLRCQHDKRLNRTLPLPMLRYGTFQSETSGQCRGVIK
jgi:hypothetical protein